VAENPLTAILNRAPGARGSTRPPRRATKKRPAAARPQAIIAVDPQGRQIRLAGPPAPQSVGGRKIPIDTQIVRVDKLPRRKQQSRATPRVQQASAIPFVTVGGRKIPAWQPIDRSGRELPKDITPAERRAVQAARIRSAAQAAANRDQGNVVTNYIGETATNLAKQTGQFIAGAPVAIGGPIIGTARDLFTATNPVSLTYANRQEGRAATRRLATRPADFAVDATRETAGLVTEFVKNPLTTLRDRPLETILTFMGGKAVVGSSVGAGARNAGRAGRLVKDIKAEGGVAAARAARRNRPTVPPPGAQRTYQSAVSQITPRDSAAFRTATGRRIYRATQVAADFGSKSTLPGSRRFREDRIVEPDVRDRIEYADGRVAQPPAPIVVPRRPRSADPIARGTQRLVYEPIARRLGLQPSYRRLSRKEGLSAGYQVAEDKAKIVGAVAAPYVAATRSLKGSGRKDGMPASEVDVASELRDLVISGKTQPIRGSRRYAIDAEIDIVKRTLATGSLTGRQRAQYEGRLQRLEAIPDAWLDPETRPARINRFIETAEPLYDGSTAMKRRSGVITESAAEFAGLRPLIQTLGGRSARNARADARGDKAALRAIDDEILGRSTRYQAATARLAALTAEKSSRQSAGEKVGKDLRREIASAESEVRAARDFAREKSYVGYDDAELASLRPGSYVPQRPLVEERQGFMRTVFGTQPIIQSIMQGARSVRMAPRREQFNAGTLYERGDIGATPQLPITAFSEATDTVVRSEGAASIIDRFALRDSESGQLLTGRAAQQLVDQNPDDFMLVTRAQLAKISTASISTPAGARLAKAVDESTLPKAKQRYVMPTSVYEGWAKALGPAPTRTGRAFDYLVSLWKGNVLALSPRWYVINMVGMWGQFALGAGADLQAIAMARNPALLTALPGRIAWRGLPEEMGEYARRSSGLPARGVYQRIIYKGFEINEMFESVPRRAMFWHAARQGLRENNVIGNGPISEARLAAAWLDVAKQAARGDRGANQIIDEAILVTERFMGNYSRYNGLEKTLLRRVFPFYGWMRSIHRLAFALPFKHPKRAALLGMASLMAYELEGMEVSDSVYNRPGAIRWGRNMMTQTGPANIFDSIQDTRDLFGRVGERVQTATDNPLSFFGRTATDALRVSARSAGPILGELYTAISGETPSGIPLRFSPGAQARFDTGTGQSISSEIGTGADRFERPETDFFERVVRAMTPQSPTLRRSLAGGEPYEDASTWQLLSYMSRGRPANETARLVAEDPRIPAAVPRGVLPFVTGLVGFPTTQINRTASVDRQRERSQRRVVGARNRNRNQLARAEAQARRKKNQGG